MPSRHDPAASLADILENLERIEGYVAGLDREKFGGDTLRRDAVERCLGSHWIKERTGLATPVVANPEANKSSAGIRATGTVAV